MERVLPSCSCFGLQNSILTCVIVIVMWLLLRFPFFCTLSCNATHGLKAKATKVKSDKQKESLYTIDKEKPFESKPFERHFSGKLKYFRLFNNPSKKMHRGICKEKTGRKRWKLSLECMQWQ